MEEERKKQFIGPIAEKEEDDEEECDEEKFDNSVWFQKFKRQILYCYPIDLLDWDNPTFQNISEHTQQYVLACMEDDYRKSKDIYYEINVRERLINELRKIDMGYVYDGIYDSWEWTTKRLAKERKYKYAYKHYVLMGGISDVPLKEIRNCYAADSTGLRSGPAAVALSDYLLHHKEIVKECNILELGAGTGLCGFMLKKYCNVRTVLLTDGNMECVKLMRKNCKLNFPKCKQDKKGFYTTKNGRVIIQQLVWKEIAATNLVKLTKPDVVLAADVLFDKFEDLLYAVDFVFTSMKQTTKMLLAATVNQTLDKFLQKLESLNFSIKDEPIAEDSECFLFWDRSTPMRILLITREK